MTTHYRNIPPPIKIYVDGFRIDNIESLKPGDNLEAAVMTTKIKEHLVGKVVGSIVPVPTTCPRFIIITTELKKGEK